MSTLWIGRLEFDVLSHHYDSNVQFIAHKKSNHCAEKVSRNYSYEPVNERTGTEPLDVDKLLWNRPVHIKTFSKKIRKIVEQTSRPKATIWKQYITNLSQASQYLRKYGLHFW